MSHFVSPAAPHELLPAFRALFGREPRPADDRRAERCAAAFGSGGHDPAGVFVVRDSGGKVSGAVLAQAMPGAVGVLWPPRAETPEDEDALVSAACDWQRDRGVKVCQAFVTADEQPAALVRNGFRHVTRLVFLRRERADDQSILPPLHTLTFVADAPPFSDDFRAALLTTHEETRDCPELNQGRTPDEILVGFADPAPGTEWYLAVSGGRAVGVVVLAPGSASDAVELSYLGVVPSDRGRGFGGELLKSVLAGLGPVEVSVDARNEPALRLYRRHGFVETDRREVLLASLDASGR